MSVLNYFKKEDSEKKEPVDDKLPEKKVQKSIKNRENVVEPKVKSTNAKKDVLTALVLDSSYISEKGTFLGERHNQYIFRVSSRTNKPEVKKAVERLYKVKVKQVNIINQSATPKSWRGKKGYRSGYKKAIVSLKAGDKIEIAA
jgi:large subunit ribosomal protein L23